MTGLAEALDGFFRVLATTERPLDSGRSRAIFLDISAPQYSRLCSGSAQLTRPMATKFARVLGRFTEEQNRILEELLHFTEVGSDSGAVALSALRLQVPATLEIPEFTIRSVY